MQRRIVALFTRAWIEIPPFSAALILPRVALFTRAWIEILKNGYVWIECKVALFTRAWIEIKSISISGVGICSRPLHEGVD